MQSDANRHPGSLHASGPTRGHTGSTIPAATNSFIPLRERDERAHPRTRHPDQGSPAGGALATTQATTATRAARSDGRSGAIRSAVHIRGRHARRGRADRGITRTIAGVAHERRATAVNSSPAFYATASLNGPPPRDPFHRHRKPYQMIALATFRSSGSCGGLAPALVLAAAWPCRSGRRLREAGWPRRLGAGGDSTHLTPVLQRGRIGTGDRKEEPLWPG